MFAYLGLVIGIVLISFFIEFKGEGNEAAAFSQSSVVIGCILIVATTLCFLGTKEEGYESIKLGKTEEVGLLTNLKGVFTCFQYLMLLGLTFGCWAASAFVSNNLLFFYVRYSLDLYDYFPFMMLVVLFSSCLSVVLWAFVISKLGKRLSLFLGLLVAFAIFFSLFFVPEGSIPALFILSFFSSISSGAIQLLPWVFSLSLSLNFYFFDILSNQLFSNTKDYASRRD